MESPSAESGVATTTHLVKSEDLNHHQTLYAGRCVEWGVEMAYITAQRCFEHPRPLVFMSIRSLSIRASAKVGDLVELTGRVDYLGESTIGVRVDGRRLQDGTAQRTIVTGTFLFCTIDEQGKAVPHDLPALKNESRSNGRQWQRCENESAANLE